MIYSVKRFSKTATAENILTGAALGGAAGGALGNKIGRGINKLKASSTYSLAKLLKSLEDQKKEDRAYLKEAEQWERSDPKGYREELPDLDFCDNTVLLKREIKSLDDAIKKCKSDPKYAKELWIARETCDGEDSGTGLAIGGALGAIGGGIGAYYLSRKHK